MSLWCLFRREGKVGAREVQAPLMLSAVGLKGSALGMPFFSFLPYFKPGPARVSLGYRTSGDALELAGGYRVTVLASFHEKQS